MTKPTLCRIRMIFLAAACGMCLAMGGCSDKKGQETPPTKEAAVLPEPAKKAETEAQPATSQPPATQAETSAATAGSACATMLTAKCSDCHSMERICEKLGKKSKSRWQRTITRMIDRGAKITPTEAAAVLDCLDSGTKELQATCR